MEISRSSEPLKIRWFSWNLLYITKRNIDSRGVCFRRLHRGHGNAASAAWSTALIARAHHVYGAAFPADLFHIVEAKPDEAAR